MDEEYKKQLEVYREELLKGIEENTEVINHLTRMIEIFEKKIELNELQISSYKASLLNTNKKLGIECEHKWIDMTENFMDKRKYVCKICGERKEGDKR